MPNRNSIQISTIQISNQQINCSVFSEPSMGLSCRIRLVETLSLMKVQSAILACDRIRQCRDQKD